MRTRYVVVGGVAAVLLLALVIGQNGNDFLRPGGSDVAAHLASARSDGRTQARLAVTSGAAMLSVQAADLGADLYRVSTPVTSGAVPAVTVSGAGQVLVGLRDLGGGGPSVLQVLLSDQVRWSIDLDGGATETDVDLARGRLAELGFGAGSARIEATLPHPEGSVTVRMTGGASTYDLHLPAGVPARVRLGGGAGSVTVDGVTRSGVTGGDTSDTPGWSTAADRYDIENSAGVSAITLDRA
jgi:hypothetical protein